MKFFFLGLGSIGARHVRNLYSLGERDFFAYRTGRAIAPVETECGVKRVKNYEEGLALRPDAVFITNPTSLHLPYAKKAVGAGCHVFVEKPLSNSLTGVKELEDLAGEKRCTVFVGYQMRFHPVLRAIREIIASGQIGQLAHAHIETGQYLPDWHPGEDHTKSYASRRDLGGGAILTLSHELDYAHWLLGPVRSVLCRGGTKTSLVRDVEDVAALLLEFTSGLASSLHIDYLQRPPSRGLKVVGTKGKIEWDYFADSARVYSYAPQAMREISLPPGFERNSMYLDEVKHFIRVIAGKEKNVIPLQEAIYTLKLSLASLESLEKGRIVSIDHDQP